MPEFEYKLTCKEKKLEPIGGKLTWDPDVDPEVMVTEIMDQIKLSCQAMVEGKFTIEEEVSP